MRILDKIIVIISTERWGTIKVSKHHYAEELSKRNPIYFISPVALPWSLASIFRIPIRAQPVKDNLIEVTYGNPLPKLNKWPLWIQLWSFRKIMKRLVKKVRIEHIDIVWNFDYSRFLDMNVWEAEIKIFHAVELYDHPMFKANAPHRYLALKTSQIVFCVADLILKSALKINQYSYFLDHGFKTPDTSDAQAVNLPGNNKLKATYLGNFQHSIDYDLIMQLADQNTDVDFILIGPYTDSNLGKIRSESVLPYIELLKRHKNILLLGAVPSEEVNYFLSASDINLILYKEEYGDGHCNPHKVLSYLYSGIITIASYIDQYKNSPDFIVMANRNSEIPSLFKKVKASLSIYNGQEERSRRRQYALENTYANQIIRIEALLSSVLS